MQLMMILLPISPSWFLRSPFETSLTHSRGVPARGARSHCGSALSSSLCRSRSLWRLAEPCQYPAPRVQRMQLPHSQMAVFDVLHSLCELHKVVHDPSHLWATGHTCRRHLNLADALFACQLTHRSLFRIRLRGATTANTISCAASALQFGRYG